MALEDFSPISTKPDGQREGLVWSGEVDGYLVELQTGVVSQVVHLIFFDGENAVYEEVRAYQPGDTLDEAAMEELEQAIAVGLSALNA